MGVRLKREQPVGYAVGGDVFFMKKARDRCANTFTNAQHQPPLICRCNAYTDQSMAQ